VAGPLDELMLGRQALQPHERSLLRLRPSVRLFVGESLQALALVAVTILVSIGLERGAGISEPEGPWPTFGLGAVGFELLYMVPRIGAALIQVVFTEYVLTGDRVYARTEFFSTDLKVVPYEKVTQVRLRRGLVGRLLGIAELRFQAYGAAEGTIRMRGLRDPLPTFMLARQQIRIHNTAEALVRSD
jgi:uncharacterized membrane protein YdbT with pleckstrin-like domain